MADASTNAIPNSQPPTPPGDEPTGPAEPQPQPQPQPQAQPPPNPPPNNAAPNVDFIGGNPFLFNNNNNNNNNRNRGPGGQNNLFNIRDRLFQAMYFKFAIMYDSTFPKPVQRTLEYFFLIKAIVFFFALVYIHMNFIKNPPQCLQNVQDWPRDGVLRVEIIPNLHKQRVDMANAMAYDKLIRDLHQNYHYGIGPQTLDNQQLLKRYESKLKMSGYALRPTYVYNNNSMIFYFKTEAIAMPEGKVAATKVAKPQEPQEDEMYIVEYSLEYGYLRLSAATRKRLQIPVRVVQLDPMRNKCFGDDLSKFILQAFLGYDDLLMASVRVIAEQQEHKGYLRNVVTGEHYRFVPMWWSAWSSYPTAFVVMLLFTFSISMLLRFSHHQIFVFIVDLLQMLEFNVAARFPIAPLLTVILALVGMEAIMSEFFNDTTTSFYIILIVWIADQYDAICCHTRITKRHWLRFFYLYHFSFYAYHYRFSGQNSGLALMSSWCFVLHSMFYFFHHYELPVIVQQAQRLFVARNQNAPPNAAAAIVVNRLLQRARQGGAVTAAANNAAVGGAAADGGIAAAFDRNPAADGQNLDQQRATFLRNILRQQAGLLRGAADADRGVLGMLRRFVRSTGLLPQVRVRIQIGNIQRIDLPSPEQRAAAAAAAATAAALNASSQVSASGAAATASSSTSASVGNATGSGATTSGDASTTTTTPAATTESSAVASSDDSSADDGSPLGEGGQLEADAGLATSLNVKNSAVIEYPDAVDQSTNMMDKANAAAPDMCETTAATTTKAATTTTKAAEIHAQSPATTGPCQDADEVNSSDDGVSSAAPSPIQPQRECHKSQAIDEMMIATDIGNKSTNDITVGPINSSSAGSPHRIVDVQQQQQHEHDHHQKIQSPGGLTDLLAGQRLQLFGDTISHGLTATATATNGANHEVVIGQRAGQAEGEKVSPLQLAGRAQSAAAGGATASASIKVAASMIDGGNAAQAVSQQPTPATTTQSPALSLIPGNEDRSSAAAAASSTGQTAIDSNSSGGDGGDGGDGGGSPSSC